MKGIQASFLFGCLVVRPAGGAPECRGGSPNVGPETSIDREFTLKSALLGILAVGLFSVSGISVAATIVDTGPATPANPADATTSGHRAGQFVLASPTTITSVERWTAVTTAGDAFFGIYTDAAGLPGSPIDGLFAPLSVAVGGNAWVGVSGLDWQLSPGTYWLRFSSRFGGELGPARFVAPICPGEDTTCIPAALALEAGLDGFDPEVWGPRGARTGWRIFGTTVPEPGSLALLALGLAGVGLHRRLRNK